MGQDVLMSVMTIFVVVAAIALCIQAGMLYGVYKAARAMQEQTAALMPQAKGILAAAEATLTESRKNIVEITSKANDLTAKANDLMDSARVQLTKIDSLVTDATERARTQLDRAELVVDDTMVRVQETVSAVHTGVMAPLRQINALSAGVRAALSTFLQGGRPSVAQATQEDEMFI